MLLLTSGSSPSIRKAISTGMVGTLITPRFKAYGKLSALKPRWAVDNDCFNLADQFSIESYFGFVQSLEYLGPARCLFVTMPDVVADSERTATRWQEYESIMRQVRLPLAYVAQDGMARWPNVDFDALFIGGSTEYKLSESVRNLIRDAKKASKWVHMGRVNTVRRMWYAFKIGVDSVDGTAFAIRSDKHLPWALRELGAMHRQLGMTL